MGVFVWTRSAKDQLDALKGVERDTLITEMWKMKTLDLYVDPYNNWNLIRAFDMDWADAPIIDLVTEDIKLWGWLIPGYNVFKLLKLVIDAGPPPEELRWKYIRLIAFLSQGQDIIYSI